MMLYCARCQDATLSIDLNGHPAHVCPQCGASCYWPMQKGNNSQRMILYISSLLPGVPGARNSLFAGLPRAG